MKKLLSMVLCAMMALTLAGCGGSGGDSSTYTFSSELDIKNLDSSDADDGCSFTARVRAIIAQSTIDNSFFIFSLPFLNYLLCNKSTYCIQSIDLLTS